MALGVYRRVLAYRRFRKRLPYPKTKRKISERASSKRFKTKGQNLGLSLNYSKLFLRYYSLIQIKKASIHV